MSREEAIKVLKEYLALDEDIDNEYLEAQRVAIKSLEQEKQELKQELKQEPCEDCISRAKAIKALEYSLSIEADGGLDNYRTLIKDLLNAIYNKQKKAIEDLPPVTPTRKWIPVSDRLPEPINHREYLVTVAHYEPTYKGRFTMLDEYEARDETVAPYWERNREKDATRVVAWMPLPKPYEVESEVEECQKKKQ